MGCLTIGAIITQASGNIFHDKTESVIPSSVNPPLPQSENYFANENIAFPDFREKILRSDGRTE
jgi:hypothetical protein